MGMYFERRSMASTSSVTLASHDCLKHFIKDRKHFFQALS
jgi:hypothetical protein